MIRYITFFVLQLKNCLGCGMSIGNLCLRIVLSTKHLVSNKGHIAHAWQQRLIGFVKFCRLLLNILCGYSTGNGCVVCVSSFGSGCVSLIWVGSFMGFSLARTSLCLRERWFLNAITGGSGNMQFSSWLFFINFQCFVSTCLSLWASSQKCVTKTNFF